MCCSIITSSHWKLTCSCHDIAELSLNNNTSLTQILFHMIRQNGHRKIVHIKYTSFVLFKVKHSLFINILIVFPVHEVLIYTNYKHQNLCKKCLYYIHSGFSQITLYVFWKICMFLLVIMKVVSEILLILRKNNDIIDIFKYVLCYISFVWEILKILKIWIGMKWVMIVLESKICAPFHLLDVTFKYILNIKIEL